MEGEDLVPAGQEDLVVQVTLVAQEVQEASWGVLIEAVQEDQMVDQMVDPEVGHSEGHCKGTHWRLALVVASPDWVLVAYPGSCLPSVD